MARPRKRHEGKTTLIECVIRVPGHENESTTFEITNLNGRLIPALRNVATIEGQIHTTLLAIYGERGVKISHDIPGGS